jgi:hypothetical protein
MAQSYFVGGLGDEYMRILQLQGKIDKNISFTSRPNFATNNISQDSFYKLIDSNYRPLNYYDSKLFTFKPLMFNLIKKNNSTQPYGWNDDGMIKAKGSQTMTRWGAYTRFGPLSIQYMPEDIKAENLPYEIGEDYGTITTNKYKRNFLGQSSVRLNLKSISLGWSTENIWWGPGQFSSLLMSNNAPGFPHFTFNTTKPIITKLGSFEWQLITGRLNQDTSMPFENIYLRKNLNWNYSKIYNGLNFAFQPIFLKGFFIGINRSFQYTENLIPNTNNFIGNYIPVFSNFFKAQLGGVAEDNIPRDQQLSIFTRWLFPKTHSEFYFEYGKNDHSYNFRDFWIDPQHSAIYLVGFTNLLVLKNNKYLEIKSELIQTAQSTDYLVRNAYDWYQYPNGGYTHENQILGAGSGIGNNVQTISITLIKNFSKFGIKLQRIQNQPILAANEFPIETLGLRKYRWNDISIGFNIQKKLFSRIIINSNFEFINSTNYAWMPVNTSNFFSTINLSYLW